MDRRNFIKLTGGVSVTLLMSPSFGRADEPAQILVPADKGLSEEWVKALTARGEPEVYRGDQLKYIGMPVGGVCAGLVYLGGDGKLWLWDIFNRNTMAKKVTYGGKKFGNSDGALYVEPLLPRSPFTQGFALKYRVGSEAGQRTLDKDGGWGEITFQGSYPMGIVNYRDPAVPLSVKLESFSPFIPLNVDDSSLPATVARYTVTNNGATAAEVELAGWLENVVLGKSSTPAEATRQNQIIKDANCEGVSCTAQIHESSAPLPPKSLPVNKRNDFGSMALVLLEPGSGTSTLASVPPGKPEENAFGSGQATGPLDRPIGALRKAFTLKSGESRTVTFVLSWNFPNIDPKVNGKDKVHRYATQFHDAAAVAQYIAANFARLASDTTRWCETWSDSTLPHWFLNRTFNNTCNLATTISYRFPDGEFWSWEGIDCCGGTCTHVWGYVQAISRIFPELERALREKTDYAFALNPVTGVVNIRGTHGGFAADGQAGVILRTYREHLMTVDDSFLKPLWPKVRCVMDRLIQQVNDKSLLDGPQPNTLDTAWYGEIAWISGIYLAALRAAEEMAKVVRDTAYAQKCRRLFDQGAPSLVTELFNGEYFTDRVDPRHLDAINSGTGCEIDQMMGQSWAWQVGLGRIFPKKETATALKSLWRYNFAPDAGHYHEMMKVGRWYAMPGEAGLLVCTFPKADWSFKQAAGKGPAFAVQYFNECQSGYEHEVASNMIAEGLLQEGLGVTRAIHDRYAPSKRNPYNEVECGDHYSRAMASYASFISACGFEYRGPDGYMGFAPRITPEKFKAAFTSAKGWGSYEQEASDSRLHAELSLKWGELALNTLSLQPTGSFEPKKVQANIGGRKIPSTLFHEAGRTEVRFTEQVILKTGESLTVSLA